MTDGYTIHSPVEKMLPQAGMAGCGGGGGCNFVPNLVSLTQSSQQLLGKTQTGVFPNSGFLVNPL